MSMEHRIDRLERIHHPEEESFTFTIAKPPEGLTEAQEEEWREEHRRDCEARGVFFFTLDLGAATVRRDDDE